MFVSSPHSVAFLNKQQRPYKKCKDILIGLSNFFSSHRSAVCCQKFFSCYIDACTNSDFGQLIMDEKMTKIINKYITIDTNTTNTENRAQFFNTKKSWPKVHVIT